MIHDNIEFWNAAELTPDPYQSGLRLERLSAPVRAALAANTHGIVTGKKASSIEIGQPAVVRISARDMMDDFRCLSADCEHPTRPPTHGGKPCGYPVANG